MAKEVRLADIAAKLDVSTVTVSKALSGQKGVSEQMRAKIKDLADEMGYRQPSATKKPKTTKSFNVGVIVSENYLGKYDSFYWKMYQSVATRAVQKECFTMLEVVLEEDEKLCNLPKLVTENKVDGLIIIGGLSPQYLETIRTDSKLPIVYLDFYEETQMNDSVISNGFYGTYGLTNYLFEKGHRKIAYVGTLMDTKSITDRYFGYAKSMLEHSVKIKEEWVIPDRDENHALGMLSFDPALDKLKENMPTAFVCNSDLAASFFIKALQERGYHVPQDISVVGFDNYLYPGLCDVDVTTYEVDIKEMARRALHILLKKMNGERYKQGIYIVEGHLVEKDSVKDIH